MKYLILFSSLLLGSMSLISCHDKEIGSGSQLVDGSFSLVRLDKQGKNVLNPSSTNAINATGIRTFYLIDEKKTEVNDPNMEAVYGVVLQSTDKNPDNNYLRVDLYTGKVDQEVTTTYIQWPNSEVDTVRALMSNKPGSVFISKLWLNGDLKYEAGKTSGSTWGGAPIERLVTIQR